MLISPVNPVPESLIVQVLVDASHSGEIELTVGTVEVKSNLQLSAIPHVASSDVFKKTTSFPCLLFSCSLPFANS